ncbi:MAG: hypothetical protein KGM46_04495 [Pseudomonadota bacterium]|nr:hypothetical protein [Xanthomonadaceae bacterium]MDE3209978.1 hypothetical protein [Pseudomonadota bacterium]
MSQLLVDTIEAQQWAQEAIARHREGIYGEVVSGVIWSDARGADGQLLVEADPDALLKVLEQRPMPLLRDHDPGRPIGHVLDAARFQSPQGQHFVVAVLGYYTRATVQTFDELGLSEVVAPPVHELPEPSAYLLIEIATDPRDVPEAWIDELAAQAPLPVVRTSLSHNAADTAHDLIKVGLIFAALVWNPFVKAFATEAGKAAYAGVHAWLKDVVGRLRDRRSPVLSIESHHDGCHVAFLIRGVDVTSNYAAHEGLTLAATQAAKVIATLKDRSMPAARLVYEFDRDAHRWYPSFAVLDNHRIIASTPTLIAAAAELPNGLSLGMRRSDMGNEPRGRL